MRGINRFYRWLEWRWQRAKLTRQISRPVFAHALLDLGNVDPELDQLMIAEAQQKLHELTKIDPHFARNLADRLGLNFRPTPISV